MTQYYCEVQASTIVKYNVTREQYGIGVNSPNQTCIDKGLYLIIDTPPSYDTATQRRFSVYAIDEAVYQVNKVYTVIDIPQNELDAMAQAELEAEAKNGLKDTSVLTPPDVNGSLDTHTQDELVKYRNDCIAILDGASTTKPNIGKTNRSAGSTSLLQKAIAKYK